MILTTPHENDSQNLFGVRWLLVNNEQISPIKEQLANVHPLKHILHLDAI